MGTKKNTAMAALAAVVAAAVIAVGGYQLGWWLKAEATDRTAAINQSSYQRQNALVEGILDDIVEAEGNLPPAQRTAIVAQICANAAKLTGSIELPAATTAFLAKECN
jgi:hypothetical protein